MSSTMHAWTLVMNYRNPFRIDLFIDLIYFILYIYFFIYIHIGLERIPPIG